MWSLPQGGRNLKITVMTQEQNKRGKTRDDVKGGTNIIQSSSLDLNLERELIMRISAGSQFQAREKREAACQGCRSLWDGGEREVMEEEQSYPRGDGGREIRRRKAMEGP